MIVLAILLSDIHLSLRKPRCRHQEPDWMEVQRRQLVEVRALAEKHKCPVFCGGDVFDRWNVSPELIHFAIDELPPMIAVAGNHDLPYHSLAEIRRSAFGVLVAAGKIRLAGSAPPAISVGGMWLRVHGCSWGEEVEPLHRGKSDSLHVLLAHKYVCSDNKTGYVGVSDEEKYARWKKVFDTYDAVHLGDNHTHWRRGTCFNPGSFYRRTVIDKAPVVGLLGIKGTKVAIDTYELKSAKADIVDYDVKETAKHVPNEEVEQFIRSLRDSSESKLDYQQALRAFVKANKTPQGVSELLFKALEGE